LCEKGRFSCFRDSVDEFNSLLNASKHISKATVKSAVELTEAEKNRLNDKLEKLCGGQVDMEYIIDSSLLGGLIVEVDGKIMDGSLRHKLGEMKEVMNK
jgi:F-type H+-transporting ATPase subunit delta